MKLSTGHRQEVEKFMKGIALHNPHEIEFHQAVREFVEVIIPFIQENPAYQGYGLLKRLTEPDRILSFRVTWLDDKGEVNVNKGYRVQFNNAIGPYKGGLRFHPSVNPSILKFLGFEQIFKNSLTTLPMGGGKGGSDFDPKGKSDGDVMRFCQAFMTELQRVIGAHVDIPAGDIGVGSREIGYLYGQYKKLTGEHTGVLTGKGMDYGGSYIRPEATGFGTVYFTLEMLKLQGMSFEGKQVSILGSGNVALYAAQKCIELGGNVQTLSDSSGTIFIKEGLNMDMLEWVMDLKFHRRGRLKEFADEFQCLYIENQSPWNIPCDIALPCATQNELGGDDAKALVTNGCIAVGEGANMPTTIEGINVFQDAQILYVPGKASNAGGVAASGLEMTQNSLRLSWTRDEVDARLNEIMVNIHDQCIEYGRRENGSIDYVKGANIAGFIKVADAMIAQGIT